MYLLFSLFACTGVANLPVSLDGASPADVASEEVRGEASGPRGVGGGDDFGVPLDLLFEVGKVELAPECAPGEGCFLDNCKSNGDCQSGWCVEHMGEGVCTSTCEEECPPGWSCQQAGAGGPDLLWVCVSNYTNLCRPCSSGSDCGSEVGAEDVCVGYADEGSFCGGKCENSQECPWGFSCKEVDTVEGVPLKQCVADAGVCPCTGKSVELGLSTPCMVENQWGGCQGKRVCTEEGLSACDALVPAQETCNAVDDNCDGDVDEGYFLEGEPVNLCDDGNDCTKDSCKGETGCAQEALDGVECKDGNPCTVADHCESGLCVGKEVDCNDDNPCTDDVCDEAGGCFYDSNDAVCDDSDPCTVADSCHDGKCAGVAVDCDCLTDEDCLQLEDGDVCNGILICDTTKLPYLCAVAPDSLIECPMPEGVDGPCLKATCDESTGECGTEPIGGAPCDDDNACTINDHCQEGLCLGGVAANCNDGELCTDDQCDEVTGCEHAWNSSPCNDGDPCTQEDVCDGGQCVGGATLNCDDSNPCTDDSCSAQKGCIHLANEAACSDGNECTTGDHCQGGQCKTSTVAMCDDGNSCTDDSCDPAQGCLHLLNNGSCNDGNVCTLQDHCELGGCVGTAQMGCDDNNLCTDDSCDPETGCKYFPNQEDCNDGNECTSGDICAAGWCIGMESVDCDDNNPCTDDSCDPATGCLHLVNSAPCSDGNDCTEGEACAGGWCTGGTDVVCDDNNQCTDDSCDPMSGCVHEETTLPCDDGSACSSGEACALGECVGGAPVVCKDGNECTDDSCNPATGCVFTHNDDGCEEGDLCTTNDYCFSGVCVPGDDVLCDDSDHCTDDSCEPDAGCVFIPITPCCGNGQVEADEECDDGNDNNGDSCSNQCEAGVVVQMKLWGGAGSSGDNSNTLIGGPGGYTTATFKAPSGTTLKILVGEGGKRYGLGSTYGGGGGGGNNGSYDGGSGGGGSFVFVADSMPQNNGNILAVAGGGGGCAGTYGNPNSGGPGGGESGANAYTTSNPAECGSGGLQSAGGKAGTTTGGTDGQFYQGGSGNGSTSNVGCGGGGGGLYGGGGGAGRSGAGGGGSGFVNEQPPDGFSLESGETTGKPSSGGAAFKDPPGTGDPDYGSQAGRSINSGSYHGNPGRVVIIVGDQKTAFGYTGNIQTVVVQ